MGVALDWCYWNGQAPEESARHAEDSLDSVFRGCNVLVVVCMVAAVKTRAVRGPRVWENANAEHIRGNGANLHQIRP